MRRATALFFLLALAACQPGAPGTVTDDAGRSVRIDATPERVLTLSPALTELVATAAGVERLVGASASDTFPASVRQLPQFQSFPLDVERVVELAPQLLVGSDDVNPAYEADRLAALGLPTYLFSFGELADIPRALRRLDELLGSEGGEPAAQSFEQTVATIRDAARPFTPPRVLLLVGDETLYAFGRDLYASEMVRIAGGQNLTDLYPGAASQPSEEAVLDMAPEVIFVLAGPDYDVSQLLSRHPTFHTLPAVLNRRVYGLDPDLISRPTARVAEGLSRMARILHPEAFAAGAA